MKPIMIRTFQTAVITVCLLYPRRTLALEFRHSTLTSEVTDKHSVKTTLSHYGSRRVGVQSAARSSGHMKIKSSRHLLHSQPTTTVKQPNPPALNFAQVNSVMDQDASSSLPLAPVGHLWVVRESSDEQHAPLLQEYVPTPQDTYVDEAGSPWKLVATPSGSLVVELMETELWSREVEEVKRRNSVLDPFSTRQSHRPHWLTSLEQPLNATERDYLETAASAAENSPFYLQHVMPFVLFFGSVPSSVGHRLHRLAAAVSGIGLVTAQVLALTLMVGLVLVLLIIDKGIDCFRKPGADSEKVSMGSEAYWWNQLTSWEALPGVEYMEGQQSDFHLG